MSKSGQGGGQLSADQINQALAQIQSMPGDPPQQGSRMQQYGQNLRQNGPGMFQQMAVQRPAYTPPMATTDPNLAANLEGLNGLLSASKEKKAMLAKAMMGGG